MLEIITFLSELTPDFFRYISGKLIMKGLGALFLALFLFSCTDQGCIDADDFGEYESETIEVYSNISQDNCKYDPSKALDDADAQGIDVITCFSSSSGPFIDEQGNQYTSDSGCVGLQEQGSAVAMQICIDQCVQTCSLKMSGNGNSEPSWQSTNKRASNMNYGVTIRPGSEITVRAIGDIFLGDEVTNPSLFVKATSFTPSSYDSNWNYRASDVRGQQSLNLYYSGLMNDGEKDIGAGMTTISPSSTSANDVKIFNGTRRLIAYLIPHPSGYSFDESAASEESGSINVPLLADPRAWKCDYSTTDPMLPNCKSAEDGYTSNGYGKVDDYVAGTVFPISTQYKTAGLGTYGGMIRWDGDPIGIMDDNSISNPGGYDPFTTNCSSLPCDTSDIPSFEGVIVGDLTNEILISNPTNERAYKVSFKSLHSSGHSCGDVFSAASDQIEYDVIDNNSNPVDIYENINDPLNPNKSFINITNNSWTSNHITIEPYHKIRINNVSLSDPTCGGYIVAKFVPYHDIEIHRSGLARFAILDALSGSCTIRARIINPEGSYSYSTFSPTIAGGLIPHSTNISGYYEPDFYEYGSFSDVAGKDPMENIPVKSANLVGWTSPVFVRKGQKIRFSPESWNGTFTTSLGNRKCGVGMAMYIAPKPALLCRGESTNPNPEFVDNPQCSQDYTSEVIDNGGSTIGVGQLIGCLDYEKTCDDPNHSNFCPIECKRSITCTSYGDENNNYQKTGCSFDAYENYDTGQVDENGDAIILTCDVNANNCNQCDNLRMANITTAAKVSVVGLDKCYDLENYKGKVSNISDVQGFLDSDLEESEISKGATKIPFFNGYYGNFEEKFYETADRDGNNTVFSIKSPLLFSSSGRLRFFVLDNNDDFNDVNNYQSANTNGALDLTSNNSGSGTSYNEQNGFKISTSGMLNFSNGQWMEMALCQESKNSDNNPSVDCKKGPNTSIGGIAFDGVPVAQSYIIKIDKNASTPSSQKNDTANGASSYKFDDYGNLVRTASAFSGDCTTEQNGVDTISGNYFYCHTYNYYTTEDFEDLSNSTQKDVEEKIEKLRLSFKIHDPEENNCDIDSGSTTGGSFDGILMDNNYYDEYDSNNDGKVCSSAQKPGPNSGDCRKEFVCANKYSNNYGSYLVNVKVKNEVTSGISNVIGAVIEPIVEVMDGPKRNCSVSGSNLFYDGVLDENQICHIADVGQAERIYKLLINDSRYQLILNVAIVLMFTFFGLTYLMGVSELNQSEIIARVAKIGIIYLFVSPTGWDWFNSLFVRFFKGGSDHLAFLMASSFDTSPELQSAINNADYYDKSILFSSVDRVFGIFFSDAVLKKISALLFASIFGWAYLLIVIMSFVLYVYAVSNAVLLYLTAQIFMSILFTLGPIFFIFILFNQTKEMFDNWLKQLIGFSLQQILILTTLAFFNMLMYEVIKMALGYKICWDEVWTINIITRISLLSFWTISSLPPVNNPQMQTGNIGNPDGIPSIFTILFIWVIASLMNKFIGFMSSVASDISGGISASDLGSGVAQAVGQAKKMASSAASKAYEKTGAKEMVQRLDMAVFDSGKLADQRRDSANRKNKADSQKRSKLEKAAKNAVSDYKKDNVSKLSKMTPEEQQKELNKVREDAINKAGKKMGMDEKEIKRLKDQKGLDKYHGSNVIGAAAQAARQGIGGMISGDSTIMKSMGEKDAKTSFSSSEFKEGAKKLTKEQRDELRKDNKLNIKRSTAGKALRAGAIAKDKINAGIETVGKLRDEEYRKEIANSVKKSVSDTAKSVKDGVKGAGKAAYDGVASAKNTAIEKTSKAGENLANLVSKDEDKRIEARRDIAKSVVAGTANRVAGAAVGTVSAVAATVEAMTTSKAAKEAIAQLEKQGEINKMAKGTNFARPKAEQDKIKATIKANQKQSTPDEMRDIGGQMSAMQELDYLDEQEEAMKDKSTTGRLRKKMSSAAKRQLNVKDSKKAGYRSEAQEKHNDTVDKEIEGLQGYEVSDSLEENEAKSEAADRLVDANVKIGAAQSKKAQKISDKQKLQKEAQKNGGKADTTKLDQEIAEQDAIINEQSEVANEARTEVGENFEKSSIGQSKTTLKVAKNNISGAKEKIESLEAQKERIKNGEEEGDIEEIDNSIKEQNEIVNKNSAVAHRSDVEVKNYNQKVAKLQASKFPSTKSTESTASGRDQGDTDKTGTKDSQDPEQVNRSLPTDIEIVPQEEGEEENPNPDNDGDEGGEATKKSVDNENSGAESLSSNAAENDNNTEDEISPEQQKSYDKLQKRLADRKKNNIKKSFESSKEFEEQLNTTKEQGQQNAKSRLQERLKAKGIQRSKSESDVAQEAGENQENEESENLEPQQEQQERPSSAPPELATQESDVANEENDEESNVASETDVKKETTSPERIKSSLAGIKSKAAAKSKSAAAITTSSDPIESSTTPTNSKTKPSYADHEKQFKKRLKDATAKTDSHNHRPKPNKEE